MTPNEAAQLRKLYVRQYGSGYYKAADGSHSDIFLYWGDEVYHVDEKGVVVAPRSDPQMRIAFPWHTIMEFRYHQADESARRAMQGF
jgi:hypothetical protein